MAVWLEKLGIFTRSPDARPLAEIAADIEAELAFHVEESARDLANEGLDVDAARVEAVRRFGDYARIRRECSRTQMGERLMLQRIQLVLTAVLIGAVGLLLWSNHEARAAMAAERQATAALLARIDTEFSTRVPARGDVMRSIFDRMAANAVGAVDDTGDYVGADGRAHSLNVAAGTWSVAFDEQRTAWRHGLKVAERLSVLPDAQGPEILAQVWHGLSVEHREQVMKPFVFGGGHAQALEVLELGIALDEPTSVRERAALYLQTYAFEDLLVGDGTAQRWLIEWRDRPVDEVLRVNATRWANDLGTLVQSFNQIPPVESRRLLTVADQLRPETYARAGVDLAAIMEASGVCSMSDASLRQLDFAARAQAVKVRSLCGSK